MYDKTGHSIITAVDEYSLKCARVASTTDGQEYQPRMIIPCHVKGGSPEVAFYPLCEVS